MLRVDPVQGKGRGVIATRPFAKDELIERAPVVVLPMPQWYHVERTLLADYCFLWGDEMALALGLGSLYNHSYSPNARYVTRFEERCLDFVALRDIRKGEEILTNYNGDPNDDSPMWFEVQA